MVGWTVHAKVYLGGWIFLADHRVRGLVKTGTTVVAGFTNPLPTFAVSVAGAGTMTLGFTDPISHF